MTFYSFYIKKKAIMVILNRGVFFMAKLGQSFNNYDLKLKYETTN